MNNELTKLTSTISISIYIYIYVYTYGGILKYGYPQIIHFSRFFHHKPSILGHPHFRTPPYVYIYILYVYFNWYYFPLKVNNFYWCNKQFLIRDGLWSIGNTSASGHLWSSLVPDFSLLGLFKNGTPEPGLSIGFNDLILDDKMDDPRLGLEQPPHFSHLVDTVDDCLVPTSKLWGADLNDSVAQSIAACILRS